MAIGIFKSLEFGGINSADYGVYITGEAVYNAPERAVEQVDIPGRNGAFLMDLGRFENIEVTYPCGIPGDDQADFAEKISDFRNAILSKRGYQRLTDEYNPNEYRMASYVSGMEVEAVEGQQGTVGEFELVFNCKPQRWLTSGETAVTVADGDTLTNPTLFDAEPLLEISGVGTVRMNSDSIIIKDRQIGKISVYTTKAGESSFTFNDEYLNSGDTILIPKETFEFRTMYTNVYESNIDRATFSPASGIVRGRWNTEPEAEGSDLSKLYLRYWCNSSSFVYGTASNIQYYAIWAMQTTGLTDSIYNIRLDGVVSYDGANTFTLTATTSIDKSTSGWILDTDYQTGVTKSGELINGISTKQVSPIFIDLEIGEAYITLYGPVQSVNDLVSLPSDLPKLASGVNTFIIDSTITDLTVTPRWWKV